mgnify:CR=1 FL=1
MILYRLQWRYPGEGMCYEWHVTKSEAEKQSQLVSGEQIEVREVTILTSSRATLAAWLNSNFTRDNG